MRGDGIVAVAGDAARRGQALLDHLVDDDREIVTVITGADAAEATPPRSRAWLADDRSGVEVEVHDGGQPLYPYLVGVE